MVLTCKLYVYTVYVVVCARENRSLHETNLHNVYSWKVRHDFTWFPTNYTSLNEPPNYIVCIKSCQKQIHVIEGIYFKQHLTNILGKVAWPAHEKYDTQLHCTSKKI